MTSRSDRGEGLAICAGRNCLAEIPATAISAYCLDCQRSEVSFRGDPKNFGKRWRWIARRYAPIQMVYGTVQSDYIEFSARRAWDRFERATGCTRDELRREGYRVKAIYITPAFEVPGAKAREALARSGRVTTGLDAPACAAWLQEQGATRPMCAAGVVHLVLGRFRRTEGKETGTYPVSYYKPMSGGRRGGEEAWYHYHKKLDEAPTRQQCLDWVSEHNSPDPQREASGASSRSADVEAVIDSPLDNQG